MTSHFRYATTGLLAASLVVGFAGCKKIDEKAKTDKPADAAAADNDIAKSSGLKTEKDQASYMIGLDMGKSLQPIKDEVDVDMIMKGAKTAIEGGKPLLTDAQVKTVQEAFVKRVQAKKVAEMEAAAKKNAAEGATFLASNGKKPDVKTTASGLQYQVLSEGKGAKPTTADTVKVQYKGTLLDGKTFDSSYDRGEPAVFALTQVAPGWAEGVQLMPVGSKYRLWIPSKLGYGEQGTPGGPIPPNATLVFDVELLDIVKPGDMPAPQNPAAAQMPGQ